MALHSLTQLYKKGLMRGMLTLVGCLEQVCYTPFYYTVTNYLNCQKIPFNKNYYIIFLQEYTLLSIPLKVTNIFMELVEGQVVQYIKIDLATYATGETL